ncbi:hypothetical protein LAZ67_9003863 [Cordylochernes scorpioides]|uniref:Peptidase aspartic putative domain-containing protein n=1 Tax=Cordylochernes scorpioides TaxID=51811 RepID=A0ABY6KWT1_9ARAC|nr:hypothetical protein LAZ67_9003863 [Cordylochernes scorpioides]
MAHGLYVNKGQNCILCHQIHKLNDCQRFINLPLPKKWELVKKHKLCQNCLRANHEISKCLITSRCKNCKQNHHTLLHEYNSEPSIPQPTTSQEMLISTNTICNAMPLETETNILLSTALIKVKAKDGSFVLCRALVDNGSQISLISEQCCHKLGLEKRKNSYTLKGVGDIVVNRTTSQVEIEFTPHHNDHLFSARAFVVGRVTADLPNFQIQSADFPHLENLLLADPEFYVTKPIDLILGADTFVEIILGHKTDLKHHPIALNTKLGWLVSGRIHSTIKSNTSVINHCTTELDSSIRKFWELEDVPISKAQLGIKNAPSPSLQESIQNSPSLKEFTRNSPSLQESIQNSPSLKEFTQNFPSLPGFTQNFPSLPGSIQTSPSLPDSVQGSPSLTLSLQSSKHNSPTPLQVSVHSLKEAMSPLVEMPSSPGCSKQIPIPIEEDSIESQNRVDNLPSYPMSPEQSYTLSSASVEDFKAQSGPKSPTSPTRGSESCRCSGDYTEPQMSQNSNFSCSSIEESEDNSSKSEENLSRSEDNPSKSEEIPSKSKKSRISKLTPQITSKQNQLLPSESSQPSTPEQPLASQSSEPLSSKKETSIIPKIKPPPYYRRKRQLPAERTSWDEPIESDIKSNWNKFQTQLSCLKEIKIPRYLNSSSSEIEELQLHGFCDASLNAYSAVFYLKTRFKIQKIKINLITSKTKVAPLKTITIPRLELSAALLLAQLNQVILESFPFQPDKTFLWTDSQICIDWIRSDASRWKAFVSNRVSSIQNLTQITDWFHVSSQDNPADCASRGIMPQDLVNHRIWWRGPIWLQENNVRYIPSSPTQVNLNIIQEEVGEGQVLDQTTLIQNSETMLNLEFIERYSTMTKLIRITAWCWRFYYNCLLFDPIRQKGPLTTRELTKAIQVLVKSIQQVEFCTEIKLLKSNKQLPLSNKLTSLNPFLDTQGLLRVGGRLKYSYLNENQKFPLLQPKSPRQESLIKNLLTENADIPEAIDENQEDSSILETTFVIEDEESNKDIGTPKIEISEVSVFDKSEGKYSKEPVVSVEVLDKKELCHDDSAHLNVVEADLNRPKEATSGIINVYTEANESSSKEKVVPVEIVDTSTKNYLQSGEKAKLSRWKPIDSLCLEDVKESEDDDENYSSSAYIEWPEILKKEVLRPEALEKAVNLEDFEKAAESRQLSKEHLEESTEQGSCIKAESKPWEDPIESDLAAAESDNPAVPERELANESIAFQTMRIKGLIFCKPNEWPIWFKRFQRYRIASGLSEKSENEQVNALVYIIGDKAEEILILFNLSEAQNNDYKLVVSKFQNFFIGKRNVIYERAKFNRSQGESEPVEEFITNLYVLAETCNYGILKEEMITGIGCGYYQGHFKEQCPAKDAICNKCRKKGHFAKVCHIKTIQEVSSSQNNAFIGIVGMQENAEDKWCEVIKVNDQPIKFKIDTGAEVSVMPEEIYLQHFEYLKTEKADKNLFAVSKKIEVNGMFQAFLESKRQKCEESIYIVKGVARPLLSCRASEILGLVRRINIVKDHAPTKLDPMLKFPKFLLDWEK